MPNVSLMPLPTLVHLVRLARQGARVIFIGQYPRDVPGLTRLEERRVAFRRVVASLPHVVSFDKVNTLSLGKGVVITGRDYALTLQASGVVPEEMKRLVGVQAIRRRNVSGHHYFISSLQECDVDGWVTLSVRAAGAVIFDPMTGRAGAARVRQQDGVTSVYLQLASGASLILQTYTSEAPLAEPWAYLASAGEGIAIDGDWSIRFLESDPPILGIFRVGQVGSWTGIDHPSAKINKGTALYATCFTLPVGTCADAWRLEFDDLRESALVRVNGREVGRVWATPASVDVSDYLHAGENLLEVEVTGLPANRVADLDRRGVAWRIFKEINIVDLAYKKTTYGYWDTVPMGLAGAVRLVPFVKSH